MKYRISHTTKCAYSEAVPVSHNLVRLKPRSLGNQQCTDFKLVIHPEPVELKYRQDNFGNHVAYFSIEQSHHGLTVTSTSLVNVMPTAPLPVDAVAWERLASQLRTERTQRTLDAYRFVGESPRIKPFDGLEEYARQSFPAERSVIEGVLDLTSRIHEDFTFDARATSIQTPIAEVFEMRRGVCQDFATADWLSSFVGAGGPLREWLCAHGAAAGTAEAGRRRCLSRLGVGLLRSCRLDRL